MMLTLEQMLQPVWNTETVYAESFTMVKDENGKAQAPFLFHPIQILKVTNATFTETYEQGVDYTIENDCLVMTENSRTPYFTEQEIYHDKEYDKAKHFVYPGGNLMYGYQGNLFHKHQVCVTYTCAPDGWTGHRPTVIADKLLPRTYEMLKNGKPFTVVIFGDSISAGANSSKNSNTVPHQPPYAGLFTEGLKTHFNCPFTVHNPSVGGKDSIWAKENAKDLVCVHNPDFVVIAFGMNDGGKDPADFADNIRSIMKDVRNTNPNVEFLLIGTSTANPIMTHPKAKFNNGQEKFKDAMDTIANEPENQVGVAVANIRDMQAFMHSKKRFIDTTGNNVNHPNDFFYRLYAQYLCGMFFE